MVKNISNSSQKGEFIIYIGLIISTIGGFMILLDGLIQLAYNNPFYQIYYYTGIVFSIIVIIGAIIGFFKVKVGVISSFTLGVVGFLAGVMDLIAGGSSTYEHITNPDMLAFADMLSFPGPLLILIGGIIGLIFIPKMRK